MGKGHRNTLNDLGDLWAIFAWAILEQILQLKVNCSEFSPVHDYAIYPTSMSQLTSVVIYGRIRKM